MSRSKGTTCPLEGWEALTAAGGSEGGGGDNRSLLSAPRAEGVGRIEDAPQGSRRRSWLQRRRHRVTRTSVRCGHTVVTRSVAERYSGDRDLPCRGHLEEVRETEADHLHQRLAPGISARGPAHCLPRRINKGPCPANPQPTEFT
eukprot:750457-Hanusia_phi.AAC.3